MDSRQYRPGERMSKADSARVLLASWPMRMEGKQWIIDTIAELEKERAEDRTHGNEQARTIKSMDNLVRTMEAGELRYMGRIADLERRIAYLTTPVAWIEVSKPTFTMTHTPKTKRRWFHRHDLEDVTEIGSD